MPNLDQSVNHQPANHYCLLASIKGLEIMCKYFLSHQTVLRGTYVHLDKNYLSRKTIYEINYYSFFWLIEILNT